MRNILALANELSWDKKTRGISSRIRAAVEADLALSTPTEGPASQTEDMGGLADENARLQSAMLILGAYLLEKGEAFRVGEGAELADAYSAALTPAKTAEEISNDTRTAY